MTSVSGLGVLSDMAAPARAVLFVFSHLQFSRNVARTLERIDGTSKCSLQTVERQGLTDRPEASTEGLVDDPLAACPSGPSVGRTNAGPGRRGKGAQRSRS